jgi:hypothetical protein
VNLPEAVDSTRTAYVADEVREVLPEVDILAAEATGRLAGSDGRDWPMTSQKAPPCVGYGRAYRGHVP